MAFTYEPITTQTLGSDTATVTLSSITSAYSDLRLVVFSRGSNASPSSSMVLRFNSDTGANYADISIAGNTSTLQTSAGALSATMIYLAEGLPANNAPTNYFGFAIFDILEYGGSGKKTILAEASGNRDSSGIVNRAVGVWNSTSAINSISIFFNAGNMKSGTVITLFGIKKA